jgi:hypothetical protein
MTGALNVERFIVRVPPRALLISDALAVAPVKPTMRLHALAVASTCLPKEARRAEAMVALPSDEAFGGWFVNIIGSTLFRLCLLLNSDEG